MCESMSDANLSGLANVIRGVTGGENGETIPIGYLALFNVKRGLEFQLGD